MIKFLCDRCAALIDHPRARFSLRVELFAAYDGLEIPSHEELDKRDLRTEIQQLIQRIETVDARQLERDVYVRYEFDLCKNCRDQLRQKLDSRQLP